MKSFVKIIIVILFLNIPYYNFSQDRLDRSKSALNRSVRSGNHPRPLIGESYFNNFFVDLTAQLFLYVTYYTFIGSYEYENHLHNLLTKYPYNDESKGNFIRIDSTNSSYRFIRLDMEDKILSNFSSIYGNHLKVKFRPTPYFYLQTDYYQLFEFNRDFTDYTGLTLFNFNFGYDRIKLQRFNLGWTIGANYIADTVNKAGASVGLNTEIFFKKPFSMLCSVKLGGINELPLIQSEINFRYHVKRFYFCMGYEFMKIAEPRYNFFTFGGGVYL